MSDSGVTGRDVSGFVLEETMGVIIAVRSNSQRIEVGQRVYSNGRMFRPEGCGGTVVGIVEPYTHGRSSDILLVRWDGSDAHCLSAKFKDLDLPELEG